MIDKKGVLATFVLFSYNQERFVREAVNAALNQNYANLEIILSDDCSTDSTFEIIKSVASQYSGSHEVIINNNPINLGLARHFSEIVSRARGEIIVVAAGDDISLPHRVTKTVEILSSDSEATFVSFTDIMIDVNGKILKRRKVANPSLLRKVTLVDYIAGLSFPFSGASRGFKKNIFNTFGNLNDNCPTEDTPYILRGLMLGHALISSESGILYRRHESSLSRPASLHSMKFEEIKKQYLRDAEIAYNLGLISKEYMYLIGEWAERNLRRRIMASVIFKNSKRFKCLIELILSKDFSMREKVGIMKSVFISDN